MEMVNSSLNVGEELAKIKNEYTVGLSEEKLVGMQSTLFSILIAVEDAATEETQEQSREAIHLFNAISAELKTLQFGRHAASFY